MAGAFMSSDNQASSFFGSRLPAAQLYSAAYGLPHFTHKNHCCCNAAFSRPLHDVAKATAAPPAPRRDSPREVWSRDTRSLSQINVSP